MRLLLTLASILFLSTPVMAQGATSTPVIHDQYILSVFQPIDAGVLGLVAQSFLDTKEECLEKSTEINYAAVSGTSPFIAFCSQRITIPDAGA